MDPFFQIRSEKMEKAKLKKNIHFTNEEEIFVAKMIADGADYNKVLQWHLRRSRLLGWKPYIISKCMGTKWCDRKFEVEKKYFWIKMVTKSKSQDAFTNILYYTSGR